VQSSAPTTTDALAASLLQLWQHLLRAGGMGATFTKLESLGLGLAQLKTLDALALHEGEPTVKDLAERLGMSLPGMSRNVDDLQRRGLLERREDEHDRRMKRLRLTDEGRAVIDTIASARLAGLESFTTKLPPEQRDALADALAPILEGLDK
jgi:DNA-binding MarR family transcriptional regulator